jgi:hypothetical protein
MTARAHGRESVMKPEIGKPGIGVWPALVIATALVAGVVPARAQDDPSRPITVIVPFPAGGASDVVARKESAQIAIDRRTGGSCAHHATAFRSREAANAGDRKGSKVLSASATFAGRAWSLVPAYLN